MPCLHMALPSFPLFQLHQWKPAAQQKRPNSDLQRRAWRKGHSHVQCWYTKFSKVSFSFCLSLYSRAFCFHFTLAVEIFDTCKQESDFLLHMLDLHFKNTATSTLILCRLPFSGMDQIVSWTALDAIFNLALSRPGLPVGFGTTIQSGLFRYDQLSCNLSAPHSSNIPRTKDVCSVFNRKQPRLIFPMLNAFSAPWAHPCGLAEHTKCIKFC